MPIYTYAAERLEEIDAMSISVSNYAEFNQALNDNPYGKIELKNDIKIPESYSMVKNFEGTLDGKGYKITNLKGPIFREVNNAILKNLVFEDVAILVDYETPFSKAPLAETVNNSIISNIHVMSGYIRQTVSYSKAGAIGGLVGEVTGSTTIENSSVNLNIQGQTMGGLVGRTSGNDNLFENNMVLGVMETSISVVKAGGISSIIEGKTTLRNSYIQMDYLNTDNLFRGVSDFNGSGVVENIFVGNSIFGKGSYKFTNARSNYTFKNNRVVKDIDGAFTASEGISSDYSYNSASLAFFSGVLTWDFANVWEMSGSTPILKSRGKSIAQIDSVKTVRTFKEFTDAIKSNSAANVVLAADLDGSNNTTISTAFTGTIEGNGYKISNLQQALFAEIKKATIKNLVLNDANIKSGTAVLASVASNSSLIEDVHVVDSVLERTSGNVGLVVGELLSSSKISKSSARGTVTGRFVGLLVGLSSASTIENSYAVGKISKQVASDERSGGLVGNPTNKSTLTNVYAKVDNNSKKYHGGLLGWTYSYSGSSITVKNGLSLSDVRNNGKKFSYDNAQSSWTNNYQLSSTTGVANASPIITATEDDISKKDFYTEKLNWNTSDIWFVDEASSKRAPTLRNSDPYYQITSLESPMVDTVLANDTVISGNVQTGQVGQRVVASILGKTIGEGKLDSNLNFKFMIAAQHENTAIEVAVFDNVTSKSTTTYVKGNIPLIPQVEAVKDTDTMVSGYTTPNVEVTMSNSKGENLGKVTSDTQGSFMLELKKQTAGTELIFVAKNSYGQSDEQKIVVKQTPYQAPELDNDISASTTKVTGSGAKPNSDVVMKRSNLILAETTADKEGKFTLEFSAQQMDTELTVYYIVDQTKSDEFTTSVISPPPGAPTVNPIDDRSTNLSGTTEINTNIKVTNEEGKVLGDGISNQSGDFNIKIPVQLAGTKLIVTPSNRFGIGESKTVVVDLTAPDVPIVNPVSTTDEVVSGQGKVGATAKVRVDGATIGEGIVDQEGNFEVKIPKQKFGTVLEVYLENEKGISRSINVEVGMLPPDSPQVNEVFDNSEILTGTGEPEAEVTVRVGSKEIGKGTVDEDGNFAVQIPKQNAGIRLNVFLTNEIGKSDPVEVEVQLTAPEAPAVDEYYEDDTMITGTGKPGSKVLVEIDGVVVGTGNINMTGEFSLPLSGYKVNKSINVYLENVAGVSETTTILVKLSPPASPTLKPLKEEVTTLIGKGKENTAVLVYKNDELIGTGQSDANGDFKVEIPGQQYRTELTIVMKNAAGTSPATLLTVGLVEPDAPQVSPVTDNDDSLSGLGKKDSEIIVYANNRQIGRGNVQEDGTFKINIASQKVGTVISVYNSNAYGTSDATEILVTLGAPGTPKVDEINDLDTTVSGIGKSSATMVVLANDKEITRTTVADDNSFAVEITSLNANDVVTVYQLNDAGQSEQVSTTVQLTAPQKPSVDSVNDQTTAVKGTGKPNATANIKLEDGTLLGFGKVDQNGNFSVNITKQAAYTILLVTLENEAGVSPFKMLLVSQTSTSTEKSDTDFITGESATINMQGSEISGSDLLENIEKEITSAKSKVTGSGKSTGTKDTSTKDKTEEETSSLEEPLSEQEDSKNTSTSKKGIAGLDELNEITAPVMAATLSVGMFLVLLIVYAYQKYYLGKEINLKLKYFIKKFE
ncbi:Ig-like domain-containing protein [Lactococcus garvieae]|uniref:Ig-like domain-containing protein n=1 Tax=Lactococcus garvieae TaxID=1363 RepID=A0AA46YQU7_9LACT|nr:Ig-like domain-containing protein [Lactococcus garvieae]UYT10305.1 Ig-like domain-containing protein [Lactococcus garvieae]UYT12328.1 Ig-like domain-containing protein [Lactococcus garvieae]